MSKLYAITNQKGGVGKTTTCACLGTAFTELEKKVLTVDLDPQAALTTGLGFDPDSFDKTIYNALIDDEFPIREIIGIGVNPQKIEIDVLRLLYYSGGLMRSG